MSLPSESCCSAFSLIISKVSYPHRLWNCPSPSSSLNTGSRSNPGISSASWNSKTNSLDHLHMRTTLNVWPDTPKLTLQTKIICVYTICYSFSTFNPFKPSVPSKGQWQTMKTQIRHRRTQHLIWGYTVCIKVWTFYKCDNNRNYPDTPYIENGPVQRVNPEKSTRHKWVMTHYPKYLDTFTPYYNCPEIWTSIFTASWCVWNYWVSDKQCRSWWDATLSTFWSGSTLFAQDCLLKYLGKIWYSKWINGPGQIFGQ